MAGRNQNVVRVILAIAAALLIVVLGMLALRQEEPAPRLPTPTAPVPEAAPPKPVPPAPLPPLDRWQMLTAAAIAADAVAGGQALPDDDKALVGRSFTLRLPFGCAGPTPPAKSDGEAAEPWASWRYDARSSALRLRAQPERWGDADWIAALAPDMAIDAVEGFWIERPWTRSERCPAAAAGPEPAAAARTVAIAQFFAPDAPRTLRRGSRPYSVTVRTNEPVADAPRQYDLVISGRVSGFADGQPVHCRDNGGSVPPTCVIAVEYARIAFEDPKSGETLADWIN